MERGLLVVFRASKEKKEVRLDIFVFVDCFDGAFAFPDCVFDGFCGNIRALFAVLLHVAEAFLQGGEIERERCNFAISGFDEHFIQEVFEFNAREEVILKVFVGKDLIDSAKVEANIYAYFC